MDRWRYLRESQYRDDTNLNARFEIHRRFSTNRASFHHWLFDRMDLPADDAHVLEVGCGPGQLWARNSDRTPSTWSIVLTDFSQGMVAAARLRLGDRFLYAVADAEALPYPTATFDAVVAHHMLYHVPGIKAAIQEVARVLRPGGTFYAATNGRGHLREIDDLISRWHGNGALAGDAPRFSLENGADQLRAGFADVGLYLWEDALRITEAEPVVAYVRSTGTGDAVDLGGIRQEVTAIIEREGAFRVRKVTGVFVAVTEARPGFRGSAQDPPAWSAIAESSVSAWRRRRPS